MESKFNDWRTVNKYLRTSNFLKILESNNTNYIVLSNLLNNQTLETSKLDLSHFKTISQLKDYAFAELLYNHCKGDYRLIRAEVDKRNGDNTKPTYQMNRIKKMLPFVLGKKGHDFDNIIHLKSLLKENTEI